MSLLIAPGLLGLFDGDCVMTPRHWLIVTVAILASPNAQAQQTGLASLACNGTTTTRLLDEKEQPISMGIIVDFNARTVQGFSFPGVLDYKL